MIKLAGYLAAAASLTVAAPAGAHEPSAATRAANAPFEWLIGDWISQSGENRLRQNLSWGPHQSYLKYSAYIRAPGQPEHLHFEGIAVWNAKSKMLDYVCAVEPGSGVQEKGTIRAGGDGSIVREVELTGADGRTGTFRQQFWKVRPGVVATSLMRKTANGWAPNFPGAERIEMTRKPAN